MLKIKKVFNNNAVLAENENAAELVVLGKGIAFGKKCGDDVEPGLAEKTFSLNKSPFATRLTEILSEIPQEYFRLIHLIVDYAHRQLEKTLSNNIYVSLTDHLYHAVERAKKQQSINNGLLFEIKRLYKNEYQIGQYAVELIKQELAIDLGDDEAGFVALHIFNARTDNDDMADTMRTTQIVRDILSLVGYHFNRVLDESDLAYSRFVTHLQYFAQRLFNAQYADSNDDFLYQHTKTAYPDAYRCVKKIDHYLQSNFQKQLNQDEQLYLTIHIQRLIKK
ncbi:transcription antiterminator BglG [Chelonobacter oris]|uniref:Transcription antiterminator BglG n=1 Tax=Chelonobacter oris TaxID=505317 RepID=A0A0A3B7M5_9PAST|nr:PRD domain-containing protein [Chelonobacter oris]KGQ69599.1 transcription antiterminator BglG [Chelonobacter oris]MDH3001097.1 transcription antiterminator BglG [Chelonobacter oris]